MPCPYDATAPYQPRGTRANRLPSGSSNSDHQPKGCSTGGWGTARRGRSAPGRSAAGPRCRKDTFEVGRLGSAAVGRGPYPAPHTPNGFYEVQNRARALDNNVYLIANNIGTYYLDKDAEIPIDPGGGNSMIVDYKGQIVGRLDRSGGSTWVAGTIDIEALRRFRASAQWDNWLKDLTTEQYQIIYEQPVYPRNLYLDRKPYNHAEYRRQVIDQQTALMFQRGIWTRPDPGQRGS